MAYTKYSLTPSNNTATPPDGAPEGMLPSAVNDTMRDMMAQIRDVGDGIRDGTYTMTAAKITGGTITGVAFTGNTFTSPVISGGSINNTPIGASTANTGAFTTLSATGATTFSGATVVSGSLTANTFSSSGATITGGTINSTAIGGTTAATGKFTTLEATGVTTVQAGTVSAPAITTSGDTNTGIFFPAADTIAFTEGGVESMRIDSSGNVGIGTSSPAEKLDVFGQIQARPITNTTGNSDWFVIGSIQEASNFGVGVGLVVESSGSNTYGMTFGTRPAGSGITERMRIDSSGNVGIGTNSPASRLNVAGGNITVSAGNGIAWSGDQNRIMTPEDNVAGALVRWASGGICRFLDGSTETLRLTATGAVILRGASNNPGGIGITFPATQSASSDANTLDDYEEGTFTPVLSPASGSITAQSGAGFYTKIGRTVTIYVRVKIDTVGTASGTMSITGLPFSVKDRANTALVREDDIIGTFYGFINNTDATTGRLYTLSGNTNPPWTTGYLYAFAFTYQTT